MIRLRFLSAAMAFFLAAAGLALAPAYAADPPKTGETVRPEVGKPLQAAQEMLKTRKYKDALAKIGEADNAASKTAYESYLIQMMRGSVANAAGETDTAIKAFEAVMASGKTPAAEQLKIVQALAGLYYRNKEYAKSASWAARYFKDGGKDPSMRSVLVQSYYLGNDCASVSKLLNSAGAVDGAEVATNKPAEEELQILANCYLKQKDTAGYVAAIEKLAAWYSKKEYWTDLLNRIQRKPGFSDRLAIDVFRLKRATGNLGRAADYMEMTQLALQAGAPAEAKKVVDQGFSSNALGTGSEAERHKRLRDLVLKTIAESEKNLAANMAEAEAAKDGTALINIGFNQIVAGQSDKGLALMEKGIKKDNLKRPEDAKLHLGIAYILSGQKAKAVPILKTVRGNDGAADLARLWILQANRG